MVPHLMVRALRFDLFCLLLYAHSSFGVPDGSGAAPPIPPRSSLPEECVSFSEDSCPAAESQCPCVSLTVAARGTGGLMTGDSSSPSTGALQGFLCCHLTNAAQLWIGIRCAMLEAMEGRVPVALHIRNSTLKGLAKSLDEQTSLPLLSSLTVTHSDVPLGDMTRGPLTKMASKVACLNLSSNGMGDLPTEALTGLSLLRVLDLSHNNITHFPDLPPRVTNDRKSLLVDISGNEGLLCSGVKEAMSWNTSFSPVDALSSPKVLSESAIGIVMDASSFSTPVDMAEVQPPLLFHNKEHTYCITLMENLWFHWSERIPLDKIEDITKLECPGGQGYMCVCTLQRLEQSEFSVAVDCSGRGLTKLPSKLPKRTRSLNVTNNKITSLEPLGRSSFYSEIREFYAENNEVTSIEVLEGSNFLNNFQHLFLSGNKLTNLPMYILNRMFNQDSKVFRILTLGKNEYHCDCNTYSSLKDWILQNKKQIPDHEEMLCYYEVYNTRIIDLQADDVCSQKDWKDYLPFVVLVEVLLLIVIVTKVSYDYWIFKTKGYLPWPASRTPKLPCCDWAFDA